MGNREGFPTVPGTPAGVGPHWGTVWIQVSGRPEEIVSRDLRQRTWSQITQHLWSLWRVCLPMVLASSDKPSSHILGKYCLEQEATEGPAKTLWAIAFFSSTEEITYPEAKDPKPSGFGQVSLTQLLSLTMYGHGSKAKAYLQRDREVNNVISNTG